MTMTPFAVAMHNTQRDISRAVERIVQNTDAKQWMSVAVDLGRVEELANKLADTCRLANDALWDVTHAGGEES